ncbi:glycine cleavage system T protein (aminomethyltransferase) [Leptolyngbya sp. PCC 7375]|nr:glycine cleavage system T protein (aminomethyltransferase) [Leptolyngbya sp. PCC 7375]
MKTNASVVIIGAGIVGCSTAYHLAKLGWHNIVVVEQGPLFATGGSTSHAPGLVFQTNASRTMTLLAKYTAELYSQLSTDEGPAYYAVGGIEVAYTEARVQDLKRKLGWVKSWGLDGACLLTPAEIKTKVPPIDETKILGGYYVPTDGIANALRAAEALANGAVDAADFYGETMVTDIEVVGGQVQAVVTDKGRIETDNVLVCAGIWGPRIGRMVGEIIPLTPVQHQYVKTGPIPGLANETEEIAMPIVRHQDHAMYFRQHQDCWGIGSYQHEPLLVDPDNILPYAEAPVMPSVMPFTEKHFTPAWESTRELFPAVAHADLTDKINGMFSFTPDGGSVVGESATTQGFWVAEAVWVTHGGGVGKMVAELMTSGVTSFDLHEMDIHRFPAVCKSADYVLKAGAQQYDEVYDIIHPLDQQTHSRGLRVSPFYPRLQDLGAQFVVSAGWERPQYFEANANLLEAYSIPPRQGWEAKNWSPIQAAEHLATRDRIALYDLTPFAKFEITGPGVVPYLQNLCANNIDKPVGKVIYTAMLDTNGGIMCDLTVSRLGPQKYWVITGASVHGHDLAWMRAHLPMDNSVQIVDVSSSYCCVGLWGPKAEVLLQSLTQVDVSKPAFGFFTNRSFYVGTIPVLASRVSYVGEEGWEIYALTESGLRLWDMLWASGQEHGIIAAGLGAFDTLRLEKGFLLWGTDIHTEYDPYEAGLGFAVRANKETFIGKNALLQRQAYPSRKLCYLTLDNPAATVMGKEPVGADGKVLGYVTSAGYGYSLGRCVVYAYLPLGYSTPGTAVTVDYFGEALAATVVEKLL